ncbi:unnamed protein product [Oikopleura dioica]|uniref:Uncharacterized protein n=1 Tax=Oikopleura dioica TaxID=34765 RepID=E4Y3X8_OIKDI|nr:unnamed protein product [Oikopleura dioica]
MINNNIKKIRGQPAVLSPANRVRQSDGAILQSLTVSKARTICLPKNY